MNSKCKTVFFISIFVLVFIACSPALYMPTSGDTQKTGVSADTLILGRNLYVNNCGSCHSLYKPERFTSKDWDRIMPVMQKKAKCNSQETSIMMDYLKARFKHD